MGYAVAAGETARAAFERILKEELQVIRGELSGIAQCSPDAVHDYRRHLKKARSLVRMARHALPDRNLRSMERDLAEATRLFAAWREREALQESLEWMVEAGKEMPDAVWWERVLPELRVRLGEDPVGFVRDNAVEGAAVLLDRVRDSVCCGGGSGDSPIAALCRGAGSSYRQARKAMMRASAQPAPEVLHEWRKHAKHLRHHVQVLSTAWPACFGALESELHRLTDTLGRVHDLALLHEYLQAAPPEGVNAAELAATAGAVERNVKIETEHAFRLGALLFTEKYRAFRKRIRKYVLAWEPGADGHGLP